MKNSWDGGKCGSYPAIMSKENGVTLYVSVNHTLCVEDRQRLQDRQTHGGNLLLVHPGVEETPVRYVSLDFSPSVVFAVLVLFVLSVNGRDYF